MHQARERAKVSECARTVHVDDLDRPLGEEEHLLAHVAKGDDVILWGVDLRPQERGERREEVIFAVLEKGHTAQETPVKEQERLAAEVAGQLIQDLLIFNTYEVA